MVKNIIFKKKKETKTTSRWQQVSILISVIESFPPPISWNKTPLCPSDTCNGSAIASFENIFIGKKQK